MEDNNPKVKEIEYRDKNNSIRKIFKVIPKNRIVVGDGVQTSIEEELYDVCNSKEVSCIPAAFLDGPFFFDDEWNHAVAKCDPRDEWNEKTGIDVVSSKLDYKEHMRKARRLEKTLVVMNSLMRKMEDLCQKHQKKAAAIRKDLEDYYGGIYK